MSRHTSSSTHQRTPDGSDPVPAVLRHVLVTVTENGGLEVTVDGGAFPPPPVGAWTRADFGSVLDAITQDRTVALRVEVHESDGSVFTDLIRARKPTPPDPVPQAAESSGRGTQTRRGRRARHIPDLVEVCGEGFVPGEDVAVAVIVSHTDATGTGHARALLDPARLDVSGGNGEVIEVMLYGRVSGAAVVQNVSTGRRP